MEDVPDYPSPYGLAGWTTDDKALLIYDRCDIWRFDPSTVKVPVNLTVNGKKERLSYRRVKLDMEEKSVDINKDQLLTSFNESTKGSGYYNTRFTAPAVPGELLAGNFMLQTPLKAKKADVVLYTTETFGQYPDLQLADLGFREKWDLNVFEMSGLNYSFVRIKNKYC